MKRPRQREHKQRRATISLTASEIAGLIAGRPGLSFQSKPRIPMDAEILGGEFNPFRSVFRFIYQTEAGFGYLMYEDQEPPDRDFRLEVADMEDPVNLRALVAEYLEDNPQAATKLGAMALVIVEEVQTALFQRQCEREGTNGVDDRGAASTTDHGLLSVPAGREVGDGDGV